MKRILIALVAGGSVAQATERYPEKPFARMVDIPEQGQLVVTPWFTYSAFQSYWQGTHEVDLSRGDLEYDVEYYRGMVVLEYAFHPKWALDLTVGYVDQATRCLNEEGSVEKSSGLMDITFGMRYVVTRESAESRWTPDFTVRVGGIVPGSYDEEFPFAPGLGEVGIEPAAYARKTIWGREGDYAGGLFASAGYRHMVSYAPDSILLGAGFFQRVGPFTAFAGWRQQQALSGPDVSADASTADPYDVVYTNRMKEMNYMAEWGGTYRLKNGMLLQFYMNSNFDGRNTGEKLTYSGAISIPFQLFNR
ncbi:MAG: hypothetical protein ACYDC1_10865 [Limisphaerales bacterium]